MSEKKGFQCESCKKTKIVDDDTNPSCCGKRMKQVPLDICIQPSHAEHARPMTDDEPCNDFRSG